jgi:hydroxyethylthiazole kinase-like uncharacterized protein yjeF
MAEAKPHRWPDRPHDGHKGLFGRVLVVGGDASMFGAAALAGTAALRAGSGLVQIAVPEPTLPHAISITPELIGLALQERSDANLLDAAESADVLVIGPGMGKSPQSRRRLFSLFELEKPSVLDADALNLLSSMKRWPRQLAPGTSVLTPHPGEMKRLAARFLERNEVPTDATGRLELATLAARALNQTVLLKGHRTVIVDAGGARHRVNRTGDSSLSKAGAGDVLAGLIGSLIGQGMKVFDAACAGAWIHGRAGETAGESLGRRGVLARDVIDAIPRAMANLARYP